MTHPQTTRKIIIRTAAFFAFALLLSFCFYSRESVRSETMASPDSSAQTDRASGAERHDVSEPALQTIAAGGLNFKRVSRTKIKLTWPQITEVPVERYHLQRRRPSASAKAEKWETIRTIEANSLTSDAKISVTDKLASPEPQQYQYRVIAESPSAEGYLTPSKKTILASNVMVCIDAGHFAGRNAIAGEQSYGYAEGDFSIRIATELKKQLKKTYGIDSYLTRKDGTITLGGYTDAALDSGHISLRGEYAAEKDSDLFLSLHTNANGANANGYDTTLQPASIGKTLVIVNIPAMESECTLAIANSIGTGLSRVNDTLGISATADFRTAEIGNVMPWTNDYNDSLDAAGAVVSRLSGDTDYYGILRGTAKVDVPGIIVVHSFHTIAEMRRLAMETDLYASWAQIDARGIAEGYHFISKKAMP